MHTEFVLIKKLDTKLLNKARTYLKVERLIAAIVPNSIAPACKVIHIDQESLQIAVPSPMYASKMRYLVPRLVQELKRQGWCFSCIKIRIQNRLSATKVKNMIERRDLRALDTTALDSLRQLKNHLDSGPLSEAVDLFLRRYLH